MTPDQAFGCRAHTIRLMSGRYFDLADPRPDQFELDDVAHALARVCRFGGHVPGFYSVARHLMNCGAVAARWRYDPHQRLAVLLHDAGEAFIGDVVKPLKTLLPDYARVEAAVDRAIGEKFGIDLAAHADAVKRVDRAVLIAERRLLIPDELKWTGEDDVPDVRAHVRIEEIGPKLEALAYTAIVRMAARKRDEFINRSVTP